MARMRTCVHAFRACNRDIGFILQHAIPVPDHRVLGVRSIIREAVRVHV